MPQKNPLLRLVSNFTLLTMLGAAVTVAAQEDDDWSEFETSVETSSSRQPYEANAPQSQDRQTVPFQRRIMKEDITIRIKTLRLNSGKKVRLVYGIPKKAKNVPAVIVMDVETDSLSHGQGFILPGASKKARKQFRDASYLLRSPFGSNMLGNGFAVAYVVADDLESLRTARTPDWIGIFDKVRDLKSVDGNNVFLFSTREYANLSVYLTSKYNFSGFILEEPSYLLFSTNTHESVIKIANDLSAEEIWNRTDPTREFVYESVLNRISTPIVLIRNPDSIAYAFNQKTLISKLNQSNVFYETIEVRGEGRSLTVFGGTPNSGVIDVTPKVSYNAPTVSKWVSEIITYMRMNSSVDPIALRDPSALRRG